MTTDYVSLCGVMWRNTLRKMPARELVRALHSEDPDVVLASLTLFQPDVESRVSPH
jgi:hypothetical protein